MKLSAILLLTAVTPFWCHESVSDALEKEGKDDDKVTEESHCWCKSLKETLAARGREQEFRLKHLNRQVTMTGLDNEKLQRQISEHQDTIRQHEESVEGGLSAEAESEKVEFHAKALKGLRDAREVLPKSSAKEVHSALDDLEALHEKKLKEAKDDRSKEQLKKLEALKESRARMIRLEKESAAMKGSQLEDGESFKEMASGQIAAYGKQQEVDAALSEALARLCSGLETESTERTRLRQQALIADSQKAARTAHAAWQSKAKKLSLATTASAAATAHTFVAVRRLRGQSGCDTAALERAEGEARMAEQALEDASSAAEGLKALLGRSSQIHGDLQRFLKSVALSLHLFENVLAQTQHRPVAAGDLLPSPLGPGKAPEEPVDLKEAMAELGREVKKNLESDVALFDGLEKLKLQQLAADGALLTALRSAKAETAKAAADLKC